jgi:hypothetical protein
MMSTGEGSGAPVPPYEGRQTEAAEVDAEPTTKDGARTAGATGPVLDDEMKADDPSDTERGRVASPADEQPAEETPDGPSPEATTGPAHTPGTPRGEDHS